MNEQPEKWYSVSVAVAPDYVEAAEFAFNGLDSLGSEVDMLTKKAVDLFSVTAYFAEPQDTEAVGIEMRRAAEVYGLAADIDFVVRQGEVTRQDWLAEWKKYWKPVETGRFIVAAPWHEVDEAKGIVIRIEPNMAFGTGTHETTKLCLEAIDRNYQPGQSFLDVGTGTGILAIAAAKMAGPDTKITAVDNDPDAVAIAIENAKLNGVAERITIETGTIESVADSHDIVCANLTADVIIPVLPELAEKTGSFLILSGILAEQEDSVLNAMPPDMQRDITQDGEWIAITARRS